MGLSTRRLGMTSISSHDNSPDHHEHTNCQEQMDPSRSIEHECADCPDHNQRNTNENTEIHELTGCAMDFKLPS